MPAAFARQRVIVEHERKLMTETQPAADALPVQAAPPASTYAQHALAQHSTCVWPRSTAARAELTVFNGVVVAGAATHRARRRWRRSISHWLHPWYRRAHYFFFAFGRLDSGVNSGLGRPLYLPRRTRHKNAAPIVPQRRGHTHSPRRSTGHLSCSRITAVDPPLRRRRRTNRYTHRSASCRLRDTSRQGF